MSTTTNYGYDLPDVGGDTNNWGTINNDLHNKWDSHFSGLTPTTSMDIDGGSIDGVVIGAASPAAATVTTLETTVLTVTTSMSVPSVDIDGGSIDGTIIGGATPASGSFTAINGSSLALSDSGTPQITVSDTDVTDAASSLSFNNGNIVLSADTNNVVASSYISFELDTTEFVRITSSGLGIGTNNPAVSLDVDANDAIHLPTGTTAQRPSATQGRARYNSTDNAFEIADGANWNQLFGAIRGPFRYHSNVVNADISFASGENAIAAGPITISSGVTVTVNSGAVMAIV